MIFLVAALTKLGEFWARQREAAAPGTPGGNAVADAPDRGRESAGGRSRSVQKKQPVRKMVF
jgi:hypothetical protein